MQSPIPEYLSTVLDSCTDSTGALADYIPELAQVDPDRFALALTTIGGSSYAMGDADDRFTIQSMSKPFTYALALRQRSLQEVLAHVGVEPSGEAFNEISLEPGTGRPRNPMINAGAIATFGLLQGDDAQRDADVLDLYSALAGRRLDVDEAIFESEMQTAHRNIALGHLLAAAGIIERPEAVVRGYIRQCAVRVTVRDLAVMAATLANRGVNPVTGERVVEPWIVRQVLSVMTTCGMYDASGAWLARVGIPAKSGVSGGIIGVLPGQAGIAVFSPRLDPRGNSVRGVQLMEKLSDDVGMHMMTVARPARSVLRSERVVHRLRGDLTVYQLQGDLLFASVEALVRHLADNPPTTPRVVFDLRLVDQVADVARRTMAETTRRLAADGLEVAVVDPDHVLRDYLPADGGPEQWTALEV